MTDQMTHSTSPITGTTLHGQRRGGAVQLEEGVIDLGDHKALGDKDVQQVMAVLAQMGISEKHVSYSFERDPELKNSRNAKSEKLNPDNHPSHFTLHLKNLDRLKGEQGISDVQLLDGLRQGGLIDDGQKETYRQASETQNRSFTQRLTKEGPRSAFSHLFHHAAVTLIGGMYILDDTLGILYSQLLNRQSIAKKGYGDLGLSLFSLVGSSSMFLWGNTRSKKTNEEKEMVRFKEYMKSHPYGQTLTSGQEGDVDERSPAERRRETLEQRAAPIGTGGNAIAATFIAKAAYDTQNNWRWAQFVAASSGFALSTVAPPEGAEYEQSALGRLMNSNPLTRMLSGVTEKGYDFLQSNPYSTVSFLLVYNGLGMRAGIEDLNRAQPKRTAIRKGFHGPQYSRIKDIDEHGTIIPFDDETAQQWWRTIEDADGREKSGKELDKGVAELNMLIDIRGSGWAVRDDSGELRAVSPDEHKFLLLQDGLDEKGKPLQAKVKADFDKQIDKLPTQYTLQGDAATPEKFNTLRSFKASCTDRKGGEDKGTLTFYRLSPEDTVDKKDFHDAAVDYQMFGRLKKIAPVFIVKNIWSFITNGLFALSPKRNTRIDPEAQCSLIAQEILDAVHEGITRGATDRELMQQSTERLAFATDYFAELPAMKYAVRQGLIEVKEGQNLQSALIDKVNQMAERMAPLTDREVALGAWKHIYNDTSAKIAAMAGKELHMAPAGHAPSAGMDIAQSLSQEQKRQPIRAGSGATLDDSASSPAFNEFAGMQPELLASKLESMRQSGKHSPEDIVRTENLLHAVQEAEKMNPRDPAAVVN